MERVAALSEDRPDATSLVPDKPAVADALIAACNALPKTTRSREIDALFKKADDACASSTFLAGERFSIADACLLPFLQRVEDDIPSSATHLRAYMERAHKLPAFSKTVMSSWWWWW